MYRQGDLLLVPVRAKRLWRPANNGIVLAGKHTHRILNGIVYFGFSVANRGLRLWCLIEAKQNAKLVHEEHKPINLKQGYYGVIRQREYLKTRSDGRFRSYWVAD